MTRRDEEVGVDAARRIAVRAQALDGSAGNVLETVRRLNTGRLDEALESLAGFLGAEPPSRSTATRGRAAPS